MWTWLTRTVLVAVVVLIQTAAAAAAAPSLVDNAHLLSADEAASLTASLQDVEGRYGVRLAVVTVPTTKGVKAGDYANKLLDTQYTDG